MLAENQIVVYSQTIDFHKQYTIIMEQMSIGLTGGDELIDNDSNTKMEHPRLFWNNHVLYG